MGVIGQIIIEAGSCGKIELSIGSRGVGDVDWLQCGDAFVKQPGRKQTEHLRTLGFDVEVLAAQLQRHLVHLLCVGVGRVVLVGGIFLVELSQKCVAFAVKGAWKLCFQLRNALQLLLFVLRLLCQTFIQFLQHLCRISGAVFCANTARP